WLIGESAADLGRALHQEGELGRVATLMREGLLAFTEFRNLVEIHASLADLTLVALVADQPMRAAQLLGVARTFPTHTGRADMIARAVTYTHSRIGEAVFATEAEAGGRLAWHDVLAEIDALVEAAFDATTAPPPTPTPACGLSRREIEVLQVVAEGYSSREIAETLFLSERTVETHIFHIYNKLNVSSRAAATAHAIRLGLL
ncbi:MAG TPA: response regulator transcription factor, partial [Thermomicrobiales bacterium]|nr:response regulator transcription factor [Thermomicrobiales bacterium]